MNVESTWNKLSIFVYNKNAINQVLLYLINTTNNVLFLKGQIIISKKWQLGPHIEMIYSVKDKKEKECIEDIILLLKQYLQKSEIEQEDTYKKYEILSHRIAELEDYKGAIGPLKRHLEVVNESFDWNGVNTIFPSETYKEIEQLLSDFVCETYSYFSTLTTKEQDAFLAKCMIILGNQQEKNDFAQGGIRYGYMTFQSHYYGFLSQLHTEKDSEKKILEELQRIDESITDTLYNDMGKITSQDIELSEYSEVDKKYLISWRNTVNRMLEIYNKMLLQENVEWNQNHDMTTFMVKNGERLSGFHSSLKDKDAYMDFLNSHFFLKHRLTINAFYTILPLFSVSPLRKHKLCKYVSDAVEKYYEQDYAGVMEIINNTYQQFSKERQK